jgi:hypothetical protein
MMQLPLIYALLVALEIIAPTPQDDARIRMDVISGGVVEHELEFRDEGDVWTVDRIGGQAPEESTIASLGDGAGAGGTATEAGARTLLFELERSDRYGHIYTVFFPDRAPAVMNLGAVAEQSLSPSPEERREIQVSPNPPAMGAPDSGGGGVTGSASGATWTILERSDGIYLQAPSIETVIVVRP